MNAINLLDNATQKCKCMILSDENRAVTRAFQRRLRSRGRARAYSLADTRFSDGPCWWPRQPALLPMLALPGSELGVLSISSEWLDWCGRTSGQRFCADWCRPPGNESNAGWWAVVRSASDAFGSSCVPLSCVPDAARQRQLCSGSHTACCPARLKAKAAARLKPHCAMEAARKLRWKPKAAPRR